MPWTAGKGEMGDGHPKDLVSGTSTISLELAAESSRHVAPASPTERRWGWFFRLWDNGLLPALYHSEVVIVSLATLSFLVFVAIVSNDSKLFIYKFLAIAVLGTGLLLFHVPTLVIYLVALPAPVRKVYMRGAPLQWGIPIAGGIVALASLAAFAALGVLRAEDGQPMGMPGGQIFLLVFAFAIAFVNLTTVAYKRVQQRIIELRRSDMRAKVPITRLIRKMSEIQVPQWLYNEAYERVSNLAGAALGLRAMGSTMMMARNGVSQSAGAGALGKAKRVVRVDAATVASIAQWRAWIDQLPAREAEFLPERLALLEAVVFEVDAVLERITSQDWASRVHEELMGGGSGADGSSPEYGQADVLKSLLSRTAPHMVLSALSAVLVATAAALPIATAFAQGSLIGVFSQGIPAGADAFLGPLALLCGLEFLEAATSGAASLSAGVLAEYVHRDVQTELFRNVCACVPRAQPINEGDMAKRFNGDTTELSAFLAYEFPWAVFAPVVTLISGLVALFQISWLFGCVFLITVPAGFVLSLSYPQAALSEAAEKEALLADSFSNYAQLRRLLSLNSGCHYAMGLVLPKLNASFRAKRKAVVRSKSAEGFILLWQRTIMITAIIYGVFRYSSHPEAVTILVSLLQVLGELLDPVEELSFGLLAMAELAPSVQRVDEATNWLPGERRCTDRRGPIAGFEGTAMVPTTSRSPEDRPDFSKDVNFRDVAFSYSSAKPVLRSINMTLHAGHYTCVVGFSGAGKSTLFGLLTQEISENAGEIRVGGRQLSEYGSAAIRSQLGVVMQQVLMIDGTVAENICLGKPDATDEQIEQAARAAECHDFIMTLPQAYETVLGSQAEVRLSGGQLQRISLARALVRQPRMLLLDEATSALDPATEAAVVDTLISLVKGTGISVVSITHRLSTAVVADEVIVLKDGFVVENGDPRQLLNDRGGKFYELVHASDHKQPVDIHCPSPCGTYRPATLENCRRSDASEALDRIMSRLGVSSLPATPGADSIRAPSPH